MQGKLNAICREPLVHFLVIGTGLFLIWSLLGDRLTRQPERILITPGHIERLAQGWTRTHLRPPSPQELASLIEQEIDEEILYREAMAMGLDRDDLVIRRRLAVKMDFISEDLLAATNPTDDQLEAFLHQQPDKFNLEPLTTFSQVFVNKSQRGAGAMAEATRLLASLNEKVGSAWETAGDPLPLPNQFEAAPTAEIAGQFGRHFPAKLADLPTGRWSGPVESRYGLHLILIKRRTSARTPALHEVHDAVLNEWRNAQRQLLSENLRRERRNRYIVTVQMPDWAREDSLAARTASPKEVQ
jgi:hypothetical protein